MKPDKQAGNSSLYYLLLISSFFIVTSMRGPMVSDLIDRSHRSQVKAQLSSLRTSLVSYSTDLRHFPFTGNDPALPEAYADAWQLMINDDAEKNILKQANTVASQTNWDYLGMSPKNYAAKWRGPYLGSGRCETFADMWGNPIAYYSIDDGKFLRIYLHSAGEDGDFDLGRPALASVAATIEPFMGFSWDKVFRIFPRSMADAHNPAYAGDDIVVEVGKVRKTQLAARQTANS